MNDVTRRVGWYSFEKLEVYHLAVRLRVIVLIIISKLPAGHQDDYDQANRSTKSAIRNICEGAGEFRPREKARFYRMSLRSVEETGGTLRIIETDTGPDPLYAEAHAVGYELIAKLTVLCRKKGR